MENAVVSPAQQQKIDLVKDVFGLMGSLIRKSERAAVVIAAARLDVDLELLLKRILHRCPGGTDPLFDSDRALGTFSAKIFVAYRLGILNPDFEHVLQILRKIRNDFAHQLEHESLSSARQKSRLAELIRWAEKSDVYKTCMVLPVPEGKTIEHVQFVVCVLCMVVLLQGGLKSLNQVYIGEPLAL